MLTIDEIKNKINKVDNSRYGGAGHPKQIYNEIPFPDFQDMNVWRNSNSRVDMIMKDAGDVKGKEVLDLGCNVGRFCFEFSKRGAYVTGVDIDKELVEIANDIADHYVQQYAAFHVGDISTEYLSKVPAGFDIVLFLSTLNHMLMQKKVFSDRMVFRELERIGEEIYFEMGGDNDRFTIHPQGQDVIDYLEKYSNYKYTILGRDDVYQRYMIRLEKMTLDDMYGHPIIKYIKGDENTPSGSISLVKPYLVIEIRKPGYYSEHYVKIMNRLKNNPHPNIPRIYDVAQDGEDVHVLREYIKGDLIDIYNLRLIRDLQDMLKYCEDNNIIHRDFMKQNIVCSHELDEHVLIDWAEASDSAEPCKPVLTNKWMDEESPMTREFDKYMTGILFYGELK